MQLLGWSILVISITFLVYVLLSKRVLASESKGFYSAGLETSPAIAGMAVASDWMSAASYISMPGIIAVTGFSGLVYVMGWSGGYVLLAMFLAPYLRKFGKFTVPDFVGDRYYSNSARAVAVCATLIISIFYISGQVRCVGIIAGRLLETDIHTGILIAGLLILAYALLGGLRGVTATQTAQYIVMIFGFLIPVAVVSFKLTGVPLPHFGMGADILTGPDAGKPFISALEQLRADFGLSEFTGAFSEQGRSAYDFILTTLALMAGTAALPHILSRFYMITSIRTARFSAAYSVLFIAILYTAAPGVAAFAEYNLLLGLKNGNAGEWMDPWKKTGLVEHQDQTQSPAQSERNRIISRGESEDGLTTIGKVRLDSDVIVPAYPEMAGLPDWITALLLAGALAASLSTAAGLLLTTAAAISHDLYYRMINPNAPDKALIIAGRGAMTISVCISILLSIYPPGYIAQTVAFAFGIAASCFFPIIILGIFWKRTTREGAISGMCVGGTFTLIYVVSATYFHQGNWLFGISPEGIGSVGMLINFVVTFIVSLLTQRPPFETSLLVNMVHEPVFSRLETGRTKGLKL